jgi:plastocyanin
MGLRTAVPATLVALALGVGLATAQTPVPTVTLTANPAGATLDPGGPIAPGPTRLNVVRPAGVTKDLDAYVALLVPGVTPQQLLQAIADDDKTNGESALGLVSIQASVELPSGVDQRAVTFTVKPGLTYGVVVEQPVDRGTPPRSFTAFTSGDQPNGATAPAPAATIRMQGLRFRGSSTLPRTGTVRFENRDGLAHFAVAVPLRKGVTRARLGAALRTDNERAVGRLVAGQPYLAQQILSGGDTTNDQEVSFPKAGRYGLVCFIDGHERLGMYRIVTVK